MPNRFALVILAAALSMPAVTAQVRGGGPGTGFGISPGSARAGSTGIHSGGFGGGPVRFRHGHSSERRSFLYPYSYFYPDSDFDSGESSKTEVVVVQAPAPAPAPPPEPAAPRESVLIEWQGDHFVRSTTSARASAGAQVAPDYSEKSAPALSSTKRSMPARKNAVPSPAELPAAVLVFHDGRQEEVSEYTIMNGTIYSKADYWTTGSWTRKTQIADLDVPATLKLNQQRGLKFVLPASPNQVVVRP